LSLADKYYNTNQQLHFNSTRSIYPQVINHRETPLPTAAGDRRGGGGVGNGNGYRSSSRGHNVHKRVGRAFFFALLCTLPIALLQSGAAWVSYWVEYEGSEIEREPRTLIGYFLAVFWYGTPTQCNTFTNTDSSSSANDSSTGNANTMQDNTTSTSQQECTLCTFPAASAIIHLLWTFIFLLALWTVTARIAAAALNRALQKRLRILVALYTIFAAIGCACLGVSVVEGPFTWINQGVWLGYVATVAATALLLSWEVVIVPVHSSHVAARRALEWQEGDSEGQMTYAQAVVATPDFPPYSYSYLTPSQQEQQQQQQQLPSFSTNASSGGGDSREINGYEISAPPFPPPPPPPPYCHVELATQPPSTATSRKSRSRLSFRISRASSTVGSEDDAGDKNQITARDVLVDTASVGSTVGGSNGTVPMLPSPFMGQQQRQQQFQLYTRSESPGGVGNGGGGGAGSIPALHTRYYSSGNGTFTGNIQGHHFAYRPSSASSSTAGSVGSGMLGQGRSSWPTPPSPQSATAAGAAGGGSAPSVAALHLASYYQPHWQQQQQLQRGSASAASHRPLTASSNAPPPSTASPVYQAYAGAGGGSGRIKYTSGSTGTAGGVPAGGLGLGLFGYHGLGGGVGGGSSRNHYHNPSSSFGRAQESIEGTPTSSGTATPTPQSRQQPVQPPPWL